MLFQDIYVNGEYLEKNPTWHLEESPWKAVQILHMIKREKFLARRICEIGCGAGEILKQLQNKLDDTHQFWGYEISPQAFELCKDRCNERLHFKLADIRKEEETYFDLLLIMDVIEHLEDYFTFLKDIQSKGHYKILHIPLDLSVQTVLRRNGLLKVRQAYGHIHYFTKEIALQMLQDVGYKVIDYFYTSRAIEMPTHELPRKLLKLPRKLLFTLHKDLAVHLLGGWSLLVLAV